jgi:phosphate transport system protein
MRRKFDEQLTELNQALIEMATLAERAINDAIEALVNQDVDLAKQTSAFDEEINSKEKEVEALCLKLLLQQQPVASDLRLISSVLKIITDLERIGDHAEDISEISLHLVGKEFIKKLEHIPQMAAASTKMVKDAIDSFVSRDLVLATEVIASDDIVDDLFDLIKRELVDLMRENSNNSDQAIDFLMIAKYFERIGDHATNIAEWAVFTITGKYKDTQIIG